MEVKKNKSVFSITFKLKYFIINYILLSLNLKYTINDDDCIICNTILNSIICVGDKKCRFINIAKYSNGDLVVETNKPGSKIRYFYGMDTEGNPLFDNNKLYYLSLEANSQTEDKYNHRHEAENFIAEINNKEYLISISKADKCIEIYDLFNPRLEAQVPTSEILEHEMENDRGSAIKFQGIDEYLFSFINEDTFYLKKLKFDSTDISNNHPVIEGYDLSESKGKSVTCFLTDSNNILCLFVHKRHLYYYMYISVYDDNLDKKQDIFLDYQYDVTIKEDYFSKCIHLEGEAGAFAFIYKNEEVFNALILFKYYDIESNEINDYFQVTSIILDKKFYFTLLIK
jgi:hypothetical protein